MKRLFSSFLVLSMSACGAAPPVITQDLCADVVPVLLTGGEIYITPEQKTDALLICGAQIAATGDTHTLFDEYPNAQVEDLNGFTVMPGFIDSHVHVRELGMDAIKADLVGVTSAEEMVERLKAFYPAPARGQWLIGQGWDEGKFADWGYPDRAALDAAFPDNPVKLESLHGFAGFYNGAALEVAGIDESTAQPKGGTILKRGDGKPTGVMMALGQSLINVHVPAPDQNQTEQAIVAGLNMMAKKGVTSVHEAGMEPIDVAAFHALAERGELPIRVYGMLNGNDRNLMKAWFARGILDDPNDFLDIRSIKVFYDGSLGSRTALMHAPYSDQPDTKIAAERISQADMMALGEQAAKNGFQMAVHAIGDLGNDVTLLQFETILSNYPDFDHRWRIEHAQVVLPDFYKRQADLGVIASMQPSHAVGDSSWAEDRVGGDRIKDAYAWRKIKQAGGHLAFNSDLPGEPWEPMQTLYFAVNRKDLSGKPKDGWYADQALSARESLSAMTSAGAYSAFQDDRLGNLAVGKWADFVILSDNPLTVDPQDIKNIAVDQVWVAGQHIK